MILPLILFVAIAGEAVLVVMRMLSAMLLSLLLFVFASAALANDLSITSSGRNREVTLNKLLSKVPEGAAITDATCKRIGIAGLNYQYRCSVAWEFSNQYQGAN
jgi:hypothetical protein